MVASASDGLQSPSGICPAPRLFSKDKYILAVYRSGQILDGLVERDKNAAPLRSKPQQVTICYLLMTEQTGRKWSRQSSTSFGDGPIAIAGSRSKVGENSSSLCNCAGTGSIDRVRCHPDKARLGEGTNAPVCFARRLKPLLYGLVVLMIWVPEGNQRIEVKEVARFSRTHSQPLSPFAKSVRSHWEETLQDRSPTAECLVRALAWTPPYESVR
jgi:hypothetical protein